MTNILFRLQSNSVNSSYEKQGIKTFYYPSSVSILQLEQQSYAWMIKNLQRDTAFSRVSFFLDLYEKILVKTNNQALAGFYSFVLYKRQVSALIKYISDVYIRVQSGMSQSVWCCLFNDFLLIKQFQFLPVENIFCDYKRLSQSNHFCCFTNFQTCAGF